MRGRVVVLLVLVLILAAVAVGAILFLGGDDDDPAVEGTPDPNATPGDEVIDPDDGGEDNGEETDNGTPAVVNTAPVVIALQDLPRGFRITEEFISGTVPAVGIALYPVENRPENAFADVSEVVGFIVRSDIPRESPILATQLVTDYTSLANVGSDAALLIPNGLVAVTLPLDIFGIGSVAFAPQPGDYVDVILSFLFVTVDEDFQTRQPNRISVITRSEAGALVFSPPIEGRPEPSTLSSLGVLIIPSEQAQRPRLLTQRTIERAYVLHTGLFPVDGKLVGKMTATPFDTPTPLPEETEAAQAAATVAATPTDAYPTVVTLAVEPQDALVLVWALDARIPITLALRAATDTGSTPTTAVTLQYLIENYNITEPPILPFALEPAITKLRSTQLGLFSEFSISSSSDGTTTVEASSGQ